jgi:hypothetical protein
MRFTSFNLHKVDVIMLSTPERYIYRAVNRIRVVLSRIWVRLSLTVGLVVGIGCYVKEWWNEL